MEHCYRDYSNRCHRNRIPPFISRSPRIMDAIKRKRLITLFVNHFAQNSFFSALLPCLDEIVQFPRLSSSDNDYLHSIYDYHLNSSSSESGKAGSQDAAQQNGLQLACLDSLNDLDNLDPLDKQYYQAIDAQVESGYLALSGLQGDGQTNGQTHGQLNGGQLNGQLNGSPLSGSQINGTQIASTGNQRVTNNQMSNQISNPLNSQLGANPVNSIAEQSQSRISSNASLQFQPQQPHQMQFMSTAGNSMQRPTSLPSVATIKNGANNGDHLSASSLNLANNLSVANLLNPGELTGVLPLNALSASQQLELSISTNVSIKMDSNATNYYTPQRTGGDQSTTTINGHHMHSTPLNYNHLTAVCTNRQFIANSKHLIANNHNGNLNSHPNHNNFAILDTNQLTSSSPSSISSSSNSSNSSPLPLLCSPVLSPDNSIMPANGAKKSGRPNGKHGRNNIQLWQFLKELLNQPHLYENCIKWINRKEGEFRICNSVLVANLWGKRKNRPKMNYDKLSRSIRQYYKKNIMIKTTKSQRLVYKFVGDYMK